MKVIIFNMLRTHHDVQLRKDVCQRKIDCAQLVISNQKKGHCCFYSLIRKNKIFSIKHWVIGLKYALHYKEKVNTNFQEII
jgi:hypothetical protein